MIGFVVILGWAFLAAPAAWGQDTHRDGSISYEGALHEFNNSLFANAARSFRAFRKEFPDHPRSPDAMFHEAESYLALGREDDAIRLLRAFEETYPRHPFSFSSRLSLGKYFFERGDYDRAILTLEAVLERSPTPEQSAIALYWMGESAAELNRADESLRYFEQIVRDYPQTDVAARAAYMIAYTQVNLGRYDRAAEAFERLDRQFAASEYASNMGLALAEVYYEMSDFSRAAVEIERRLPNLTGEARDRAIFLLAESQNQNRNSEQAIVHYRHFTEGDPDSPYFDRALYGLAWNYHYEGAYQWASDNFARVRDRNHPDLGGESAYYAATNLRLAENLGAAATAFTLFLDDHPRHHLADHGWLELGMTLYEQRRWRESRDAFSSLTERFPDSDLRGEGLKHLGNTEIALGNFEGAHRAFDEALSLGAVSPQLLADITFQQAWLNYRNRNYATSAEQFMNLFLQDTTGPVASEALFWSAESQFQNNQFGVAENLFSRYLRDFPGAKHADAAQYALGWAHFRQGAYADAIPRFEAFLRAYRQSSGTVPYRADAQLRLADSYFALKRYAEAVRVYGQMAAEGDDYALYQIGQAYSNAGDAFEATSTFRQLIEQYPSSEWREESQYSLGYLFFLNQEYEQAIIEYDQLIASYPLDGLAAKAQYGKGDAYFNAGDINAAVDAYQLVLTQYPDSPFIADAAAGIQFALMAAGQEDRADVLVDSLTTALAGTPAAEELLFRQAEAKYQAGSVDESLADFQRFLETAEQGSLRSEALFYLGQGFLSKSQPVLALQRFRELTSSYPNSARFAEASDAMGSLLLETGQLSEAETVYRAMEQAVSSDPRQLARARYGLSRALLGQGRGDEAETLLRDIVTRDPNGNASLPAYLGLGRLAQQRGDLREAEELFDRVARGARDETGAEALFLLGDLQMEQGRLNEGIETMSRMQAVFGGYSSWVARSLFAQGSAFEQQNNPGQAVRLYEMIQSMYPDSDVAESASRRLEVIR